jgi:putative pyruvate formate lyase activating enzyme
VATVTRNLSIAAAQGDLIVRHLLLPGHMDCCYRPIVDYMSRELPNTKFSIRDGYLPRWQARHYGSLANALDAQSAADCLELASSLGLNIVR